jgi:transmembrane sensor
MSEQFSPSKPNDITAEACAWIAQIESESMKSDDLAAYKEWVERSPAHKKEIKRLAMISADMNVLADMAQPLKEAAVRQRQLAQNQNSNSWSMYRFASVAVVLVISLYLGNQYLFQSNISVGTSLYTTVVGEHREVLLSDGTILELNTDSQVEIDYSLDRRKVRLLKGEAFFQVAHNPDRPFIVYAREKAVRAVGTAFVVRLSNKALEVLVTEGKVELTRTETPKAKTEPTGISTSEPTINWSDKTEPIYIEAGETVVYREASQQTITEQDVQLVSKREIKRKLSWQNGLLDFSDTPLIDVVEDLSRYTSLQIEISDPELRNLKFGGLFRTNELQALFNALETTFDIRVEKIDDTHVRLSRNTPTSS